jgi:integrase
MRQRTVEQRKVIEPRRAPAQSQLIEDYIRVIAIDSPSTAIQYRQRLNAFAKYLPNTKFHTTIDGFVNDQKTTKQLDVYTVLAEYHIYLKTTNIAKNTIAGNIMTCKTFLEYHNIPISNIQFRLKVRAKKQKLVEIDALSQNMVRKIILGCQTPRLQAYIVMLAATGMRAVETLSIRYKDIDLEGGTAKVRAEFTKTKVDRTVFLTKECVSRLKIWKDYRERKRRVIDNRNGKIRYITKPIEDDALFFTSGRWRTVKDPHNLYNQLAEEFGQVLDRIGLSKRQENKGNRHSITLHSFRRHVKTTISDLGYSDYSEWFIGHSHSTYYRKPQSEKLELFCKIEPYLTYLDYSELEAKGADFETKLQEKDDRITNLEKQLGDISKMLLQAGILKMD